jgi:membrane protease YdiL (CAAX protease family)
MRCSRWGVVLVVVPASAWAAQAWGLGLQVHECRDTAVYFKLLLWGPVVEELVFRAGLQKWLTHRLARAWLANGITSFLFAGMHCASTGQPATWLVIVPSIALGWAYSKTNSLALAIGLHASFNLAFMAWTCAFI